MNDYVLESQCSRLKPKRPNKSPTRANDRNDFSGDDDVEEEAANAKDMGPDEDEEDELPSNDRDEPDNLTKEMRLRVGESDEELEVSFRDGGDGAQEETTALRQAQPNYSTRFDTEVQISSQTVPNEPNTSADDPLSSAPGCFNNIPNIDGLDESVFLNVAQMLKTFILTAVSYTHLTLPTIYSV